MLCFGSSGSGTRHNNSAIQHDQREEVVKHIIDCGRSMPHYAFYNGARRRMQGLITNPGTSVYSRYVTLYISVVSRRHIGSTRIGSLDLPGPTRVFSCLGHCIVNRRGTGHTLSITMCGRCGHIGVRLRRSTRRLSKGGKRNNRANGRTGRSTPTRAHTTHHDGSPLTSIRITGSGVLLLNPANINGACLTRTLTHMVGIPFIVASTAALARTNCMNSSIRAILRHLLRTTSNSMDQTRRNVVCVSRVSGVTHGSNRGASVAHSISNRNIRRTLLGVLRKAVTSIPLRNAHGRGRRSITRVSAHNVLFVYNNTFIKLASVIHGQLNHQRANFNTG